MPLWREFRSRLGWAWPALGRWRRPILALVGLGAVLLIYWEVTSFVAYTSDAYVTSDLIGVAPEVSGKIVAVLVRDDQTVHRGDPLLTINRVPFELEAASRRASLAQARAREAADGDSVAAAQGTLAAAEAQLGFAQDSQRRAAALGESGVESRQQLDRANELLRVAEADAAAARSALHRAEQLAAADRAGVAAASADLDTAEWRLSRTGLLAPADGAITHLTVRVGDTANANVPLIGIVDARAWRIVANFKQDYLRAFRAGETGWVWLGSEPWHWRRARIAGIARGISRDPNPPGLLPYVAPTTDWIRLQRRFPVTLTLTGEPPQDVLFMGADARVVIFP
ncbi:MAG: HlyD family secretion protein [Acetobacteraceae bacterium]|nr:HlyD family secretion protein [Acetobacteraceae bacterium]